LTVRLCESTSTGVKNQNGRPPEEPAARFRWGAVSSRLRCGGPAAGLLGVDREVDVLVTGHGARVHDIFQHLELDALVRLDYGDPDELLGSVYQLVVVRQCDQLVFQIW